MATFTITDSQDPFLHVALAQGESIFCERDAMVMMDQTLDLTGTMQGGVLSSIARTLVAGESLFTQKIVAARGAGDVLLSQVVPGGFQILDISPNSEYLLADGAFVAAESSVDIKVKTQGIGGALFGGTGGFFIMQATGRGQLCVGGFGSMFILNVVQGQHPIVDNGHVVAWSSTLQYEMSASTSRSGGMLSNLISSQTSGEGMVMKFSGVGQILICSRQRKGFLGWLAENFNGGSNSSNRSSGFFS